MPSPEWTQPRVYFHIAAVMAGLAGIVWQTSQASAQQPDGLQQSVVTTSQVFNAAQVAEQRGDIARATALYRTLERSSNIAIRSEARFRRAKLLERLERLNDAATLYRKILDEQPDAQPVRIELAALLVRMGNLTAARRELRQAQAGVLPPEVAQIVQRYTAALRSQKPLGGSLEVSLAPDSNINRATSATTLDTVIAPLTLSSDARQRSGLGLREASQGYARIDLSGQTTLVPRVSSQAVIYQDNAFDDVSASAQLGLEWRSKADRITPSAGYTWRWYGGRLFARTQTLNVDWLHPVGKRAQLVVSGSASSIRFPQNRLQDGMLYSGSARLERALTPRSGMIVSLSGNRLTARDPGYATVTGSIGGTYWREFGKATVFGSLDAAGLIADARLNLFPRRRADWYLRASGGAVWRKITIAGFSPIARVSYERNWSAVGLYDFRRFTSEVGITRGL